MTTFHIEPTVETVHGYFSRDLAPVLTIDSGDTVIFRTLDAGWGLEGPQPRLTPRKKLQRPDQERHAAGHAMCGPVAVRGAQPGTTLAIEIKAIIPGSFGFGSAGWDWTDGKPTLYSKIPIAPEERFHSWTLDTQTMTAVNQYGHKVAMRPFMGVMGLAPAEPGDHSTRPPRAVGGNMDCKDLVAGSTLYLPVQVDGGLFSVGDGHGVQGHGEVSGVAIECPMDKVELTFTVLDDMPIENPCANTPAGWLTMGFDRDLNAAKWPALSAMVELMMKQYHIERADALALASLVVDLHVTQVVNDVAGIHAVLPHGALEIQPKA